MRIRLRTFSLFIFCLGLVLLALTGCKPEAIDDYGHPIRLSDYRGKWVVVSYWATWCAPCINQIPELVQLKQYYSDKVVVLGVNMDRLDNNVLRDLGQAYRINYPLLNNFPIEKWAKKPKTLPVTYIFNSQGRLVKILEGPQTFSSFQLILNLSSPDYDTP